ncbi:MAG: bamD 2 [Gammaproteobacteria bacterium]|jgi:tol-pal system protein YbgF|nr:bamD 2 [Gammaproteobacteria bacterium]
MLLACRKRFLTLVVLACITCPVFAENAPVYDVDNFPPQFDGQPAGNEAPRPQAKSEASFTSRSLTQDQRLARLEQQIKNLLHADGASKTETMRAEIQSLRGQVEELSHQLQQIQNQQRTLYADLDKRLGQSVAEKKASQLGGNNEISANKLSIMASSVSKEKDMASSAHLASAKKTLAASAASATSVKIEEDNNQPNVVEEQQIYQTAYDLIKVKKYNEAVSALQKMLQKYPAGQFAANAHYWLGELYGLLNKNDQSANEFEAVVKNYPDSPKVADAQLKLGLIYAAQFKWSEAKTAFKKVVAGYPGTASARLASEQLKQLKQAQPGH